MQRQLCGLDIERADSWLSSKDEVGPRRQSDDALMGSCGEPVTRTQARVDSVADVKGHIILSDIFDSGHCILHRCLCI